MDRQMLDKVYAYLDGKQDEMTSLLGELVNIESTSKVQGSVIGVANRLKELFEAEGFVCELLDVGSGDPTLVGILGADRPGRPAIFSGHMDTVFEPGTYPDSPFRVEGDKAFGPGVLDMKGGLVISLFVAKALSEAGYQERPLKIVISGDEEIGHFRGKGAEAIVESVKGAACAFNMETGLLDNSLCYGRKGRIEAHITVHGVESHAGNDFLGGRNAIEEMAHKIIAIQALTDLDKGTTVSCGVIEGGSVCNAIPKLCKLKVECRFDTVAEMERFKERLEEVCGKPVIDGTSTEIFYFSTFAPFESTDQVMRFWEFVKETAASCGLEEVKGKRLGGSSDAAYILIGGTPVLCSFGIQGEWNHTTREYAILSSMAKRGKLVASVILNLDQFEA